MLQRGANLFASDKHGYNALHHAAQHDQPLLACYLIKKGLSLDSLDNGGHTPLHWAAYAGYEHLTRMFITMGADVNRRDLKGMTSLHLAASKGHKQVFRILIKAGAVADAEDNSGRTPRSMAQGDEILNELDSAASKHPFDKQYFWQTVACLALPALLAVFGSVPFVFALPAVGALYMVLKRLVFVHVGEPRENDVSPMLVVFVSSYLLSEYYYFVHMYDHMALHPVQTIVFLALQMWFWAGWLYVKYADPGYLPRGADGSGINELVAKIESGEKVPPICTSCLIPRPVRSKHCRNCDRCISRHDHHCNWMGTCVGQRNHFVFILILITVMVMHALYGRICVEFLLEQDGAPELWQVFSFIHFAWSSHPTAVILIFFHLLNTMWQSYILYWQLQGIRSNITTSEIMHVNIFYTADGVYRNPYDRGVWWKNLFELCHPSYVIDYSKRFSIQTASGATFHSV